MPDSQTPLAIHDVLRWVPTANQPTVERIVERIGIATFHETQDYIRAERADGKPPLRIAKGWVNGFTDQDEAVTSGGPGNPTWQSIERHPLWGLWMPENNAHDGGGTKRRQAEQQRCPNPGCGELMPLTNVCDFCG
ncbi:hypothetical protein [Curtobacterium sp. MCPF17_021]|uniref:hypothetical protein n=1 Tax=Curtobacterium sp. MCPF17_021 TaxID=2175639 RepID=UPI0011B41865|nr:hypothetical protein [Curtobacterium sp. MCPF17_021]WIE82824.1 hypothetical protein DEJ29_015765 [Curtobacterium sp. MCPF17_021]